jgi:Spy/CpxP family protein refolding chaperone
MKRSYLLFLLISALGIAMASSVPGQEPAAEAAEPAAKSEQRKPDLLLELGLSQEQVQQIRVINRDKKPVMEAANRRLREANRNLDQAIYANTVDDSLVEARLAEFQAAQADVVRLRFMNELAVRKLLTPDQLAKFIELRRRFMQAKNQQNRLLRRSTRRLRRGPLADPLPPK